MRTWTIALSAASLLVAGSAFAQDKKPAEAAAKKPAEGAAKPEMAAPKPAPELQQYKMMIGSWKCEGKGSMGGHDMKVTGTYKAAWDLDNNWVIAHFEGKAQGMPGSHKGMDIYGYDAATKMYVVSGYDNFGGWSTATSKGWEGDKQEWAGKGQMMGKEADTKWTVTKKGDKEITISGSMGGDSFEETCKK
jgi:hypothetical protein